MRVSLAISTRYQLVIRNWLAGQTQTRMQNECLNRCDDDESRSVPFSALCCESITARLREDLADTCAQRSLRSPNAM